EPACVGIALREATLTYANIMQRKAFTISIPAQKHVAEADYFGIASGASEDKFLACGLTPVKSGLVDAPYIGEFPFIMECALMQSVKLGLHTQFIGMIKDVKADASLLDKMGMPDMEKIKPLVFSPANRSYYGVGQFLAKAFSVGQEKADQSR
ncbi:MAG: flavin reductase family protein, partial [Eubacteriales bacterium]|nr:flavin reductase family protein [Eubacteriales bacterium]